MRINQTIFALIILVLSSQCKLCAITFEVCPHCPYTTINQALDAAGICDTIVVDGGKHHVGNTVIDKSIIFLGKNNPELISKTGEEIFTIIEDFCIVKGFTFSGVITSYLKEHAAIRVKKSDYFEITNNKIDSCFFGIYIEHSNFGKIESNLINGNATDEASSGNGIHVWYSEGLEIFGNVISKHRDGIYFEFVNFSRISNNISTENKRYGLHFMFSNDDEYFDNNFENNGAGVAVMFSRRINMHGNLFNANWGQASYGLLLKEIYDAEIFNNRFSKNTIAIFVEGSNRITYQYNDFLSNGWAIKFSGGCEKNVISRNNFIHNSYDLVVSSRILDNVITHNYWSLYYGYDLDKDGLGDVPFYPVKLFSYISNEVPETILFMRSLFVHLINYTEKVSPIFTPKDVLDNYPLMEKVSIQLNTPKT